MAIIEIVFWSSVALLVYAYLLYPLIIWSLARYTTNASETVATTPSGSPNVDNKLPGLSLIIIPGTDEKKVLNRLQNAANLEYPNDQLEIVVGLDGGQHLTADLVHSLGDPRITLVQLPEVCGRAEVLNRCVAAADGDIVVFPGSETMIDRAALGFLARRFTDSTIGGVAGHIRHQDPTTGDEVHDAYRNFEQFLNRQEGKLGALVEVSEGLYAIRKELYCRQRTTTLADDFLIGLDIHRQGYRFVIEKQAIARHATPAHDEGEYHRRAQKGAVAVRHFPQLAPILNPLRGRVAYIFWSHTILQWICPLLITISIISNACLSVQPFYLKVLLVHELFYLLALGGLWLVQGNRRLSLLRLPASFLDGNVGLVTGGWKLLTGRLFNQRTKP